jgi:hypothetical protein
VKQIIFSLTQFSLILTGLQFISYPLLAAGAPDSLPTATQPTTNPNYNPSTPGFSYSQQFSGYGNTNTCGVQAILSTNYGNSISPYSTNTPNTNSYTIGANLIFNSQQCIDPNKTIQLQQEQIQTQKAIACNQERGKLTALIITQNPKITPKELDNILNVVCTR